MMIDACRHSVFVNQASYARLLKSATSVIHACHDFT